MIDVSKIDFKSGRIVFCELDYRKEDMLMVEYDCEMVLDLGWYSNGFGIKIVKNHDWTPPFYRAICHSEEEAERMLQDAVERIETELSRIRQENEHNNE